MMNNHTHTPGIDLGWTRTQWKSHLLDDHDVRIVPDGVTNVVKEWHDRLHDGMRVPSGNGISAPVDVIRARWATGTPPEALQGTVADVRCLLRHLELAEEAGEALKDELAEQRRVQANLKESASQANERSREWAQKAVQDGEQKDALRGQCADLEQELRMTQRLKEETERVARIANHERNVAVDAAAKIQKEKDAAVKALMERPPTVTVSPKVWKKIEKEKKSGK